MKFYNERVEYGQIRNLFWYRNGNVLERLNGINTHQTKDQFQLQPIYLPLLHFEKNGSFILIDFAWNKPLFTVVLMNSFPFVRVIKTEKIRMEDVQ